VLFALANLFGRRSAADADDDRPVAECDDPTLMRRYVAGEMAAFEELLGRHERPVFRFILRSVRSPERAEELTQEVFLRVVRTAPRYKETAKFTTWLYTLARNICIDESRRRSRGEMATLDASLGEDGGTTHKDRLVDTKAASGAGEVRRQEFREALESALARLPDEQREVFLLRHIEGLKFVEIAKITGVTDNTVKSRMRYALASLRGSLADYDGFSFDAEDADEVHESDQGGA